MESPAPAAPVFRKRNAKANLRKRPAPPKDVASDDDMSTEDESGDRVVKKRKQMGVSLAAASVPKQDPDQDKVTASFTADRSAEISQSSDATKRSNWYDKEDDENLLGKTREKPAKDNAAPDGTYKGRGAYSDFLQKNPNKYVDKYNTVGPIKAHSTNVRTVTVTDYAPDVCKDFKQVGYCGFGDGCKFLHARDDFKQGWAIDRDWEIATGGRKQAGTVVSTRDGGADAKADPDDPDAALLEKIPFACTICRGPYKSPVMTRCEHYFCQACAMQRYRKDPTCAQCGAGTNGIFNVARQLAKLLEKKKAREERLEKAEEGKDEKE